MQKPTKAKSKRTATIERRTKETAITASVDLDGTGAYDVATGVGFLDHMIEQLARHSLIDITLKAEGDLHIDQHHTTEDSGITLGQALTKALGDKKGIRRYGFAYVPMDEALVRVVVDLSGRPYLAYNQPSQVEAIGGNFSFQLVEEFLRAVAVNGGMNLH